MRTHTHLPGRGARRSGRVATALLVGLALVAVSCGGDDDSSSPAPTEADTTEPGTDTTEADTTEPGTDTTEADTDMDESPATTEADTAPAPDPEPGPGFDGTTIKVGVMTALSGPAALIGTIVSRSDHRGNEHAQNLPMAWMCCSAVFHGAGTLRMQFENSRLRFQITRTQGPQRRRSQRLEDQCGRVVRSPRSSSRLRESG